MTTERPSSQQLIGQCQGLVRSLARSIHRKLSPQADFEDLVAYGQVGLAEAARSFDPSIGSRFSTFAYYRIRGAIYDGLTKMAWFSRSQYNQIRTEQTTNDVLRLENENSADPGSTESPGSELKELRHCRFERFRVLKVRLAVFLAGHPVGEYIGQIAEPPLVPSPASGVLELSNAGTETAFVHPVADGKPHPLRPGQMIRPGQRDETLIVPT